MSWKDFTKNINEFQTRLIYKKPNLVPQWTLIFLTHCATAQEAGKLRPSEQKKKIPVE